MPRQKRWSSSAATSRAIDRTNSVCPLAFYAVTSKRILLLLSTYTHIYIYIATCVCVCVCAHTKPRGEGSTSRGIARPWNSKFAFHNREYPIHFSPCLPWFLDLDSTDVDERRRTLVFSSRAAAVESVTGIVIFDD